MNAHRKNIPEGVQRRITKFYVSNLPERCSGKDLACFVREYGTIFDLYIARKRDKEGKRFGFVSMLDVKEKDELCKRLSSIRMGEFRLHFNIARFVLEEGEIGGSDDARKDFHGNSGMAHSNGKAFGDGNGGEAGQRKASWCNGKSFKEMLMGEKKDHALGKAAVVQSQMRTVEIDDSVKAFSSLHGRAVIVRMVDIAALRNIKCIMKDCGMAEGEVQYLRGVSALLSFEDSLSAVEAQEVGRKAGQKFSHISIWEGQSVGYERLAWLRVQGIPLHILSNDVINRVGGLFGKLVHFAERSESDGDLSFEYVGVLVGDGKWISEEVVVKWNDRKYRVWVMEEMRDWVPEFIDVCTSVDANGVVVGEAKGDDDSNVNGVDGMEFQPEVGVGDFPTGHRQEGDLNATSGFDSPVVNSNEGVFNVDKTKEDFVLFSNEAVTNFNVGSASKSKRKKYKKSNGLGRNGSIGSFSPERPKRGKRPRLSPDVFGLNPFIFANETQTEVNDRCENLRSVEQEEVLAEDMDDSGMAFDLNKNPIAGEEGGGQEGSIQKAIGNYQRVRFGRGHEIEATVDLGEKLGIDLANFESLIAESIDQEGLQKGNS